MTILIRYTKGSTLINSGNKNNYLHFLIFIIFYISFNCQTLKWAEESGKIMLYNDPFVAKHKNNYKLLRKIHYQEKVKLRNLTKLN